MRTCYYQLLGVERNASGTELLKGYRKQALLHHPDKNRDRIEEATLYFTLIQEAYQVLSDAHERKWYDLHRNEILRGPLDNATIGVSKEFMSKDELLHYHTISSFDEFDDSEKGFYSVYRNIFIKIDLEEQKAKTLDPFVLEMEQVLFYSFGDSQTNIEQVNQFYNRFLAFSSCKSFSWFDSFRPLELKERSERRIATKKNKALRDDARKEFNDCVRELARWIRKRDPRIKKMLQVQEEQQKIQQNKLEERKNQERLQRLKEADEFVEPEWAKVEDEIEFEEVVFECIVCDLEFKNEKQLKKHEGSESHRIELVQLKKQLLEDEQIFINNDQDYHEQLENVIDHLEETDINFNCALCNQIFQSQSQMEQHFNSKKHRAQIKNSKKNPSNFSKSEDTPKKERPKKTKLTGIFCNTCRETFPSRTKLFDHLKLTNHANATVPTGKSVTKKFC